ncbi:MAG: hypothetical protein COZ00_13685 [Zetaproteobacteria bacterium CG_4_10_14_0_8_um_filter_49_80]|nr:MAG: hypothetical protein AUJ56_00540 [Zetaproteobacteria bacterium CG1_02_49_23]PIY54599.1 MAG: hypothetical protein COZ00_13685 [Zetaproteobacteria bacterium CG_4_10_14_0_8_um_filter_49_80]
MRHHKYRMSEAVGRQLQHLLLGRGLDIAAGQDAAVIRQSYGCDQRSVVTIRRIGIAGWL